MGENPWFHYRLGDMVRYSSVRRLGGREKHYELYPDSLASQYMRETDISDNLDVLINLIRKYPQNLRPKEDELVVHLRAGNVIDKSEYTVEELLEKRRPFGVHNLNYVKPLSFYKRHLNKIEKQIKKITLVAGGNLTHDFTKSKEYIQAIKSLFEKSGFDVQVRLGNPPDDDFIYMCRSRFFISSGGHFSRLVRLCRAERWRTPQ
jgi:hypothetical protein